MSHRTEVPASTGSHPWRLVVCDMDGTLVRGTTALTHLSSWLGHETAIEDLESKLSRGEVNDHDVAERYARFYRGVAVTDAAQAMSDIPSISDIPEGVEALRRRSIDAIIATVSWSFAARALADLWGFAGVCGADLEVDPSSRMFTGTVSRHFAPEAKVGFVADYCAGAGIALEEVVAIGDSRSDRPLFEVVGFSVAINATSDARAAASASVNGTSLFAALNAVPGLLL